MSLVKNGCITTMDQVVDKRKYDESFDRIFGEWKPQGSRGRSPEDRASTLDNLQSSISRMVRNRVMVRMIREGKANDRGLKREAEHIERESSNRPKEMFRKQQYEKLDAARIELRRSQR